MSLKFLNYKFICCLLFAQFFEKNQLAFVQLDVVDRYISFSSVTPQTCDLFISKARELSRALLSWHSDIRLEQFELQAFNLRRIQFNVQATGSQKIVGQ